MNITLQGFLFAENREQLETKRAALEDAFDQDGTLTYRQWSGYVYVKDVSISDYYSENTLDYTIQLVYEPAGILYFSSERVYDRPHNNPVIRKRIYCGQVDVRQFFPTGQEIGYNIEVQAANSSLAYSFAQEEVPLLVIPGGIEIPGGTETESLDSGSWKFSFRKFYRTIVHGALG